VYDIIQEHVKTYDYPVCFNFPVSHEAENYALKIGMPYKLVVRDSGVELKEKS
jgi:muramoyltetrapeptide carboxypeptidase